MTPLKRNLLLAMWMATCAAPAAVLANEAAAPSAQPAPAPAAQPAATSADQAERTALVRNIRARMYEMVHTQDVNKRKELMEDQVKDMEALVEMGPPGPGVGMMMGQGLGPGPMAMGPAGKGNYRMGPACSCPPRGAALDRRLDVLERRIDMMQMLLEQMNRQ